MGTSLTSGFQNTDGMAYTLVVCVEGYSKLLTNGSTSAVTTAWSGTEWSAALPGLQVHFDAEQEIEPWKSTLQVSGLSFGVMDTDGTDEFGTLAFGSHAGVSTYLDEDLDCTESAVTVLSTGSFDLTGPGYIHIGTECISYTGGTASSFTGCVRGRFAPFKAESETAQRFGRSHQMPTVGDGVVTKPKVSSLPRTWKGRWVGVWLHRKTGTTLDTKAQAQLIWAGKIVGKRDEANGMTWMECEDVKAAVRGCTLMNDQWTAKMSEGIYLQAGQSFMARDNKAGAPEATSPLIVRASGASGANEINAGLTSLDELATALNQWFASEKAAARLNFDWSWSPRVAHESGETRSKFDFSDGSADTNSVELSLPGAVAKFMGLGGWGSFGTGGSTLSFDDLDSLEYFSPQVPFRTVVEPSYRFEVEDTTGTLWDNKTYFPGEFGIDASDPLEHMVVQVDDGAMWIVKAISATVFERVAITTLESTIGGGWVTPFSGVRVDEGGEMRLKQVAVIRRGFRQLLNRLFASTGTAAYNHVATYDVLPAQLGAAIPWELLGDAWETSLTALDQSTASLLLVIDKPTRLMDKIGADLVARFAQIVWKNGGLRVTSWGTPTAAMAAHAFTEANKATPADTRDNMRTVTNETDKHLVNVVKLKYARKGIDGEYTKTITITDKSSISDHGEREPIEIEMCNSYAFFEHTTDSIPDLANGIANMMAIFARPMHVMKRTIDMGHYENVAPGDYATITDEHARDPSTGVRGLSAKPCLIIGHRYSLGGYEIDTGDKSVQSGEVDLLLMPFSNIAAYCPAADIASYVAGTKVATCTAHAYSESTEAADATRFPVGSVVKWLEIDPDDPTAPASGLDVVAAQSGNDITLTTGIAGYSSSLRYRIISDEYANATVSQQVNVYQADDADGLVASGINAYEYGMDISGASDYTECAGTEQVALYSDEQYGKGVPLDVGGERDLARLCNNLQNWRTQPVMHSMSRSVKSNPNTMVTTIVEIIPIYVGSGDYSGGDRFLRVRPWYRSGTGASVTLTATLCRTLPTGSSLIVTDADQPEYTLGSPSVSNTWTTSSTTWAAGAASDMSLRVADDEGIAYLIIEGTEDMETRGMCQLHVGEYYP